MNSTLEQTDVLKELPTEKYLQLQSIAKRTWENFPFNPYFDSPKWGRSTLSTQLNDEDNLLIRDCKLPTFKMQSIIKELGYETLILVSETYKTHPYIMVRIPEYDNLIVRVTFHPTNYLCNWLTWADGQVVRWGNSLKSFAENNGFEILNPSDEWNTIDQYYLNTLDNNY